MITIEGDRKLARILLLITAVIALLFIGVATSNAQTSIQRQGNTFISSSSSSRGKKAKPERTKYTWKDAKGNEYPIFISNSGSCFVYRTSSKTGNEYKMYLGKEISAQICKEMGREYKPKTK